MLTRISLSEVAVACVIFVFFPEGICGRPTLCDDLDAIDLVYIIHSHVTYLGRWVLSRNPIDPKASFFVVALFDVWEEMRKYGVVMRPDCSSGAGCMRLCPCFVARARYG